MALEPRSPRLAVLIDADNTSAKIADRLFEEIAQLGEASVRRIYGDFTRSGLRGWTDILAKHAIIAHQQFAYVTGKNASDIGLVIDAMDILHSGKFDGFVIVSSSRMAGRNRRRPSRHSQIQDQPRRIDAMLNQRLGHRAGARTEFDHRTGRSRIHIARHGAREYFSGRGYSADRQRLFQPGTNKPDLVVKTQALFLGEGGLGTHAARFVKLL